MYAFIEILVSLLKILDILFIHLYKLISSVAFFLFSLTYLKKDPFQILNKFGLLVYFRPA